MRYLTLKYIVEIHAVAGPGGGQSSPLGMWMTSHGQCPRGVLVNVLKAEGDDVTRAISKGVCACECLHPRQEILYPRLTWLKIGCVFQTRQAEVYEWP